MSLKKKSDSLLLFTPFGYWQVHTQLDLAVASAAKIRGLRTTHVTCNAVYQPCTIERGENVCEACQASMKQMAMQFGISGGPLGSLIEPDEIETAETWVQGLKDGSLVTATYEDLEVGDWALSSVMTHFRIGNLDDLRRSMVIPIHRRFLRDSLLTYWAIERVIKRDRIEAAFLFNGRFFPYRAALEASRRQGVQVLVHERGRVANSFCFFENDSCLSPKTPNAVVEAWADTALQENQLKEVDLHFSGLLIGRSPNWPSFYDQIRIQDPRSILDIPPGAMIVAFFTSSSDEIASQISFAKVASQFELIEQIAEIVEESGAYLIVRHHPHIGGGPVGSPVEPSAFFEAYSRTRLRRPNIRVVMPKDELSSYALFPYLTAAIAPFTSLGLEATAFGIPTLVAKGAISSFDERYIVDDWSVSALRTKIAFVLSASAEMDNERFRTFYRTFYSRFYRFSMRFQAVSIKNYIEPSVSPDIATLIEPGKDQALDRVMDNLIEGCHIYERPVAGAMPAALDLISEDKYIAIRLGDIKARRLTQTGDVASIMPSHEKGGIAIMCEEPDDGHVLTENLRLLPNSGVISIVSFRPIAPRHRLFWRSKTTIEFDAWSRGLRVALDGVSEERILVVSKRYQLHDASIATILAKLHSTPLQAGQMATLSSWFGDEGRFDPVRVSASNLTLSEWGQMQKDRSGKLRCQDLISLSIIEKRWLRFWLRSPKALQRFFFKSAANANRCLADIPIMIWQPDEQANIA